MALIELLLSKASDPVTWFSLTLGLLTSYVVYFYYRVSKLPPGPFPLPFIGNILQLRGPMPLFQKSLEWSQRYGDPFTVWVGTRPFIMASDKDSFKDIAGPLRNILGGRTPTTFGDTQTRGNVDVVFSDFNPAWDVLRRLAHVAMRKYAQTEKLANLCANKVDDELNDVFGDKTEAKQDIIEYIENIVNNILAISSFGESFQKGDKAYETMREANAVFEQVVPNGFPSDIHPLLGWLQYKTETAGRKAMSQFVGVADDMFAEAKRTWVKGESRHFTDVLLNAREEFLEEDRASAKYLTDGSLNQVLIDIFAAGTGTTRSILAFSFLNLAKRPELQDELRQEILDAIGTNQCTTSDRVKMPKVDAFLQEIIRLHPAAPLSLPRKALADVTVNGRFIPKGTAFFINLYAVNRDKTIWGPDANELNWTRFLKPTKDQLGKGANSFGIGSRSCPGEKMAQGDLFYGIVRTLQRVKLSGLSGPDSVDLGFFDSDILLDARRQKLVFSKI